MDTPFTGSGAKVAVPKRLGSTVSTVPRPPKRSQQRRPAILTPARGKGGVRTVAAHSPQCSVPRAPEPLAPLS